MASGPLIGVRVVEFQGIGPAPFCAMLLSDMGADVVRIDRREAEGSDNSLDIAARGRRSIALNLKDAADLEAAHALISNADVLIEGFRPGVMERLGLGPDDVFARNAGLIYARMTGWGQTGPLSKAAGHDINYIALTGALHCIGYRDRPPPPPLNLVGDFGGGALYLAMGVCAALFERKSSGLGQVIDCAITDGVASLMAMSFGRRQAGMMVDDREANMLDGGAHFYRAYETSDGRYIAIGSIEPQFYALLLEKLGLADDASLRQQWDRSNWPQFAAKVANVIKTRTRDEWCRIMEGTDVCFAPILSPDEAPKHPHNVMRNTFVEIDGVLHSGCAPRFSRTPSEIQGRPPRTGSHAASDIVGEWSERIS